MIYLASNGAGSISFLRPVTDPDLSWHKATNGVIALLTSHRYRSFSPTKLETHAGHAQQSVRHAMDVLSTNTLVVESPNSSRPPFGLSDNTVGSRVKVADIVGSTNSIYS